MIKRLVRTSFIAIPLLATACGAPGIEETPAETVAEAHTNDHAELDMETLPIEFRVAFMAGHVEAGLALYRAGAPDQAAKHLLHPVSETHAAERAGIDALGFKAEVFETVSAKLEAGEAAEAIEPLLLEAETNLATMQAEAGGDAIQIISFLMTTAEEEFAIGVQNGIVTDPGEYQDAFGFSVVALKIAQTLDPDGSGALVPALEALVALWPEGGPLASSIPPSSSSIETQISIVRAALETG